MARPTERSTLSVLTRARLFELAATAGQELSRSLAKAELVEAIAALPLGFDELLGALKRDELKEMCRAHGLDDGGREKAPLVARLLAAMTDAPTPPPPAQTVAPASRAPQAAPQLPLDVAPSLAERTAPTARSVLGSLTQERLVEVGRLFGVPIDLKTARPRILDLLVTAARATLADVLGTLTRDELRAACRANDLDHVERAREVLVTRLLQAAGETPVAATPSPNTHGVPRVGDIVRCRKRGYLVEDVIPPPARREATLVKLVCLDDDAPGRPLEVLWELELGAQVIRPETGELGGLKSFDDPRHFAAYFHAVRWSGVTAADASLFQSPFRAGIKLATYQLTPLLKALELPRANLFIADDVGLGKTIEAGLVLQELLLRQRVEYALVVCPPSVCLQWQDEMSRRFGLHFEVYDREFVARRRRQRGFSVNPWATHNRFIISYPLLRRPEHLEPLIQQLDKRGRKKTLLILDEAHTVAPSSPATHSRYAVDSKITGIIRDRVAPSFENRLFLSATPHNGHSNSFSALLEILDPQRFTRGVPVRGVEQLRPVMVRRLKRDIRALIDHEAAKLPERQVIELAITRVDNTWRCNDGAATRQIGTTPPLELELSTLLQRYTAALGPATKLQRLVFINLQKRLLSSIPAFARTLHRHAAAFDGVFAPALVAAAAQPSLNFVDEDENQDPDDDAQADAEDAEVEAGTRQLAAPADQARTLLHELLAKADAGRGLPDARVLALVAWIREHMCPAVGFDPAPTNARRTWADRRILIFTESIDTKRYLRQMLDTAFRATDGGDERILELHGAMPEDKREDVQRAFNGPFDEFPVRVLLATDAAREGVNLQGRCADLFHIDIPWNPARMEQRNGRIDRTGQDEPIVRCHYFRYTDRAEDLVLATLVRKVETIERELGSLGALLHSRLADLLDTEGINQNTLQKLEAATQPGDRAQAVQSELEQLRTADIKLIKKEIDRASKVLGQSRGVLDFTTDLLRDTVDVALQRLGHGALAPAKAEDGIAAFTLPALPDTWAETLDSLRPPRSRDESLWDWRRRPPQAVVFDPPSSMRSPRVHLHLHHPLVRRLLDGFLAHGFGAHDLQRVTVVRDRKAGQVRVLAFGRLSLFGRGAARLHDTLVPVVALWDADTGPQLGAGDPIEDARALDRLEQLFGDPASLRPIARARQQDILRRTTSDFATLWPSVRAEADARAHDVERKLRQRGQTEADQLRKLLEDQRASIDRTLFAQLDLAGFRDDERDQVEQDREHMRRRLEAIRRELEQEPADLQSLYDVRLRRIEPVGLVYLWPEAMA